MNQNVIARCGLGVTALALVLLAGGCQQTAQMTSKPAEKPMAPADRPAPMSGDALFLPTGQQATSALMITRSMPREATVGVDYTYTITAKNISSNTLTGVVVRDNCAPGQVVKTEPQAQGTVPSDMMWNLGTMAAGESRTITVTVRPSGTGKITSCVTGMFNQQICAETSVVQPALAITKAMTPEGSVCDPIMATIVVKNTGTGTAKNVIVSDTLPAGLTADGKTKIELSAGDLAPGAEKKFDVRLKGDKRGRFENDAQAMADGGLKATSNKVATVLTQPELALECKPQSQTIVIGRNAGFDLVVKNNGDRACDTVVTVPLPAGTTFVSATEGGTAGPGGISWRTNLAAKGTKTLNFVVKPSGTTSVAVNASATCPCSGTPQTTCATSVIGIPAMLLDGVDSPDPVEVGGTTTYTLKVTNQSTTTDLTNVRLTAILKDPAKMQLVSAGGQAGAGTASGANISFPAVAVLKPGESRTYTVVVKATDGGQVQLEAQAVSNEITRALVKTETTNFYK